MQEIAGTEWKLVAIEPADGPTRRPEANTNPTLVFGGDEASPGNRRLDGHGGCNRFFGAYTLSPDGKLAIPGPLGSTRMACPGPIMEFETEFLNALSTASQASVADRRLTIVFEGGSLRLEAAPS